MDRIIKDALRIAKRKQNPIRLHHTVARKGYAFGGPPDEEDQEAFLKKELEGSAPQYDPEAGLHTAKEAGLMAAGMIPGTGIAAAAGKFPTAEGGFEPSLKEDISAGHYGSAALKGLGAAGDVLQAVPVVGTAAGAALKAPLAVKLASAMAPAARLAREAAPLAEAAKEAAPIAEAAKEAAPAAEMTKSKSQAAKKAKAPAPAEETRTFYHGSPAKFTQFDLAKSPEGIHLTENRDIAAEYAGKKTPNIYQVEAKYDPTRIMTASELIESQPLFERLKNAPIDVTQPYTGERFFQALSSKLGSPEAASNYLREAGVQGMAYPAKGHYSFYDPSLLTVTPEYQRLINPAGFYSRAHEAAMLELPPEPRTWEEMLALLSKAPRVQAEELYWSGIHPEAFPAGEKVSREQIADLIQKNFPQVEPQIRTADTEIAPKYEQYTVPGLQTRRKS